MRFKLLETVLTEGKNVERTFEQYKDKILQRVGSEDERDARRTFDYFIALDPTYSKGSTTTGDYGIWLLNRYVNGDEKLSSSITDTLKEFTQKKPNLEKRDINQYKSVEELKSVLEQTSLTDRQKDRMLKKPKNVDGADLIYAGRDWTVYSPNTYEASCALRNGASWCTGSTTSRYYYDDYTKKGKLYIIISTDNPEEKYQAFVPDNLDRVKEFKDAHNSGVNFRKFMEDNPELKEPFYDGGIVHKPEFDGDYSDLDEKIVALAQYLEVDPYSIEEEGNDSYTTEDGETYLVLTYDEAEERAIDEEADSLEEYGRYIFSDRNNNSWLYQNAIECIDSDVLESEIEYDIEDICDGMDDTELIEEAERKSLIDSDDSTYYDEDGEPLEEISSDDRDSLIELLKDNHDGYDESNYIDYFISRYGSEEIKYRFEDNVDWRELARRVIDVDGVANTLARYDGHELDLGGDLYAYRTN